MNFNNFSIFWIFFQKQYDRDFLVQLAKDPLSLRDPANLPSMDIIKERAGGAAGGGKPAPTVIDLKISDYIEKISVMSRDRMAVAFSSGKIVIREVKNTGRNTCACLDKLAIPCPENLKEELDQEFDEVDTDGPSLCSSRNGKKKFSTRALLKVCDVKGVRC